MSIQLSQFGHLRIAQCRFNAAVAAQQVLALDGSIKTQHSVCELMLPFHVMAEAQLDGDLSHTCMCMGMGTMVHVECACACVCRSAARC